MTYLAAASVDASSFATAGQLAALQAAMPVPSSTAPPMVGDVSAVGSTTTFARSDHTHLSSVYKAIVATTDATGNVSWSYPAGFFTAAPVIELTVQDAGAQSLTAKILTNTAAGGSAKIIASQPLPVQPTSTATLLTGLLTALNTVAASISSFNVFGGAVPVGTKLHIFAGKATGT